LRAKKDKYPAVPVYFETKKDGYMRMAFRKISPLIILLALLIVFVPGQTVFAGGCGGTYASGGGFSCGTSGGSGGGTSTTTTTTTTTSTSNNGGGGNNNHGKNVSYTINPARTGACYMGFMGGCLVPHVWVGGCHKNCDGTTTTTTTIETFTICNNIIVTSTNIGCDTKWQLSAHVDFPAVPIDTRPYPATLNRWPTVLRVDALQTASGSASLGYIPMGGGSPTNPQEGDWRNITLTLTLYPKTTYPPQVYLEHFGWITMPIGQLYTFSWPLPSHPAAGGGPTAGAVGQLQELPQDMPLYTNYARAAYGLRCNLDWQQLQQLCIPGPDSTGNYNCSYLGTYGHKENKWISQSLVHEILPTEVKNLPPAEAADTNGDGIPDAYWDLGIVIRRMNNAGSISDPVYAHSYSWSDVFYWAAREAQGQITFP
jgi:hypothetical protein